MTTNEIDAEHEPEDDRSLRLDLVGRQRPAPGAGHELVDVAVEVAVDRVRAAGRERAADERPDHEPAPVRQVDAGHLARGEDHRRHRRDEQQLDDPWLGQRDVGADRVRRACAAADSRDAVAPGARAGLVAAGAGPRGRSSSSPTRPASSAQIVAPSARWSVCVHAASRVRTWSAADDDLDRVQDGGRTVASRTSAGCVALRPPRDDRDRDAR